MIIPGAIFFDSKKSVVQILRPNPFHMGILLATINCILFAVFSWPEYFYDERRQLNSISKNSFFEAEHLKNMYLQAQDPTMALQQQNLSAETDLSFLRDQQFWRRAATYPFQGDVIDIEKNKKILLELNHIYTHSSQYRFGLSHEATAPWAWLTYQFMHAGFFHLISNIFFLVLVTNLLSRRIQSDWIFAVYILSGFGAGISYLVFSANNEIAMVGASGSICGLIAFLCTIENKNNIPWSYFISPLKGGYGLIYLPAYLLFPIYLISDFTSVLQYAGGIDQAIAHSAHVGGALAGFLLGLYYLVEKKLNRMIRS